MNLSLLELWRRPRRFVVAGVVLFVISLLLLINSALLDGLYLGSTGALRLQDADAVVFSEDADQSFLRSRLSAGTVAAVEAVEGAGTVGGLGVTLVGVEVEGRDELADGAVFGYQLPGDGLPEPPPPGQAYADRRLEEDGVDVGDVVRVGRERIPLEVIGWVDDASYQLQGSLWVEPNTWRDVQNRSRPDSPVAPDEFQVLLVRGDGVAPDELTERIEEAVEGTEALELGEAQLAIPGVAQQNNVFSSILATTYFISALVVALFFALVTVERVPLYGMLKAIGYPTGRLLAGLAVQASAIALASFVLAWVVARLVEPVVPAGVPLELVPARALFLLVVLVVVAVIGAALSFRRIARVDPASAVGRASV